MALSNDLISQFVKITKDDTKKKTEKTAYGTINIVKNADDTYNTFVVLDGSQIQTPVSSTVDVKDGDRVTVLIKDHTATVTGNISSPAARTETVKENTTKISEFDILVAHKVSTDDLTAINATIDSLRAKTAQFDNMEAVNAELDNLQAKYANIERLTVTDIDILNAEIDSLRAIIGEFTDIETEQLDAMYADIDQLKAYNAEFTYLSAVKADVEELEAKKLDATWANIDFTNIDKATLNELYAQSGLIEYITAEGVTTGYLVGVTIKGDTIEAGTLKADRLVVLGTDGNYYALNFDFDGLESVEPVEEDKIHGSVMVAESITADKISVTDLNAFAATIGGFKIGHGSLYSGVKETADNATRGIYLGSDGQINVGDGTNYLKYVKVLDENGNEVLDEDGDPIYKLEVSADSVVFGNSGRTAEDLAELADQIKIGTYTDPDTGITKPSVELEEDSSTDKLLLTNDTIILIDDKSEGTKITKKAIATNDMTVKGTFQQGPLVWVKHNGNYGCMWKEATD